MEPHENSLDGDHFVEDADKISGGRDYNAVAIDIAEVDAHVVMCFAEDSHYLGVDFRSQSPRK